MFGSENILNFDLNKVLPESKPNDPQHCPVALGFMAAIKEKEYKHPEHGAVQAVVILGSTASLSYSDGTTSEVEMGKEVAKCIENYDKTGKWSGSTDLTIMLPGHYRPLELLMNRPIIADPKGYNRKTNS